MKYCFHFFLVVFLLISSETKSQEYYWVAFSNKNTKEFSINNPSAYLSERAIERRLKQNIPIDSLDLPVNKTYIKEVVKLGAELVHSSKWLNGVTVKTQTDSFAIKVQELPFVKTVQLSKPNLSNKSAINKFYDPTLPKYEPIDTSAYGSSVYQTGILNGQFLHSQNYRGQGLVIAVIDGGFLNADKYEAFDSLWINNQILGTKDFVDQKSDFFTTNYHGMSVLSCVGGNVPGKLVGTAPKADFWLLRSEDVESEYIIEEDNWVAAAEFADSVGADVINSSLGYTVFDAPEMNHTYADLDGKTTRVTRGANIAASRGMLVFSSAGNEGNDSWKYIVAPSDGDLVIGVGAVNRDRQPAPFTSYGPASDSDIKPNVAAVGWYTYLQRSNGELGYSSGTSFSSPVMAGMTACLWQANPQASAGQVKQALEQSAHLFNNPDSLLGYGIPDMKIADQILKTSLVQQFETQNNWLVYPNPVNDVLFIQNQENRIDDDVRVSMINTDGKLIKRWRFSGNKIVIHDIPKTPGGVYILKINSGYGNEIQKIVLNR